MLRKTFTSLLLVLGLTVGVGVGCGDHVVVPKDKSGKCIAGLLTKCGETCVDTQTDLANCGACGTTCTGAKICAAGKCTDACPSGSTRCGDACVNTDVDRRNCGMCGKACAPSEICGKGKCGATCEAVGYTTCAGMMGPVDAGAAMNCVDTTRDSNNCGGCGKQCNGTQACSNGVCCDQGLIGCGGQCVDPRSDPNNCGGCGTTCGMGTPNCVLGTCSGGNNKVLILSDGNAGANTNMKKAIETAGFIVDMQDSGSQSYTGTPAGTGFGAIVVVRVGLLSGGDMASSGQQAILAAQQAGVGIVLDAYDMYENAQYNHFVSLKNLMLYGHTNGIASNGPVTVVGMQFPFFGGVTNGMTTVNQNAWFYGPPINAGTQFANVQTSQGIVPAGWYRGSPNGRIVHFGFGINWSSSQSMWTNDPMQVTWFLNGLRWAARLTN